MHPVDREAMRLDAGRHRPVRVKPYSLPCPGVRFHFSRRRPRRIFHYCRCRQTSSPPPPSTVATTVPVLGSITVSLPESPPITKIWPLGGSKTMPSASLSSLNPFDHLRVLQVETRRRHRLFHRRYSPYRSQCRDGDAMGAARHALNGSEIPPPRPSSNRNPITMRDIDPTRIGIEHDVIPPIRLAQWNDLRDMIVRRFGCCSHQESRREDGGQQHANIHGSSL